MAAENCDIACPKCPEEEADVSVNMKEAISCHDVSSVESLIKEGRVDVQAFRDADGMTFLHWNAINGNCAINRCLLLAGGLCHIDETDAFGSTALVHAIKNQKFDVAEELIEFGANVNIQNNRCQPALLCAVTNCCVYETKIIRSFFYFSKRCALSYDLLNQHSACLDAVLVLQKGKSYAYRVARLKLVKTLLKAGAHINADKDFPIRWSPIQYAVYTGDLELVETLIDAGADIDNQYCSRCTALHGAILCCNEPMVRLLLSRGASVVARDELGNTPLHWAAYLNKNSSHAAVIKELLKWPGVDVISSQNSLGLTPLHIIVKHADLNMLRFFINELNTDVMKVDGEGFNVLHYALHNEDKDVFDFMLRKGLESGISIDQKCSKYGMTSLQWASYLIKPQFARILIANGADVNAKEQEIAATPLLLCTSRIPVFPTDRLRRDQEMILQTVSLLLESGSEINTKFRLLDGRVKTILELLIESKRDDLFVGAARLIVQQVAALEARRNKPVFDNYNLRLIDGHSKTKSYYEKCRAELKAMKIHKIEDTTVTYFTIFSKPVEVLAGYARNEKVVEELRNCHYLQIYPIYSSRFRTNFDAATARQKMIEQASIILSTILQFADPSDVVFETILKYLSNADIEFLINTAPKC